LRRILATDLAIWPVLQNMASVSDTMLKSPKFKTDIANYILLYDQIIIPTGNLQILPVLRHIFGEAIFDELIKTNIIVFARYNKWFSYLGNGGGLRFFESFGNPDLAKTPNLFHSYFAPLDEAIDTALQLTTPILSPKRTSELRNLLLDHIIPVGNKIEMESFRTETYHDILGSPYLRNLLSIRNEGRNLDSLKGINSNQMTVFSPHTKSEKGQSQEIDSVLRVAFENFILGIGSDVKADEITGDGNTFSLLKAKGQRIGANLEGVNAFAKVQEISGIPDIGSAFSSGVLSAEQLLDLRESKHSQAFRNWFISEDRTEKSEEIVERYVNTIGKTNLIDNIPMKILRFVTTTSIGTANPILGAMSGVIDSFFLSKWFPEQSPRLFLQHTKSVMVKSQPEETTLKTQKMSGRDRNRPCSCGSKKKYKHCCGH